MLDLLDQLVLMRDDAARVLDGVLGLVEHRVGRVGRVRDDNGLLDVDGEGAGDDCQGGYEDGGQLHSAGWTRVV